MDRLGVPEAEVHELSRQLYHGYGTTMCGLLCHGYQLDVDDWHAAVHDSLEYDRLLLEQPTTRQVLAQLNLQKHLLTNADARHAIKCLKRLGISDCFEVRSSVTSRTDPPTTVVVLWCLLGNPANVTAALCMSKPNDSSVSTCCVEFNAWLLVGRSNMPAPASCLAHASSTVETCVHCLPCKWHVC